MKVLLLALMALTAQLPAPARTMQLDTVARLRSAARDAEARYERLARRLAPLRMGGFGTGCDEIVGRYCVRYDSPDDPLPDPEPEPARLTDARRDAIEALRAALTYLPGEFETAGPLVRYLVEDGRADEALPVARLFRAASGDSVWGPLLEGFALHASDRVRDAEIAFAAALERMPVEERERFESLDWILDAGDRSVYRQLDADGRRRAEAWFWRLTDPLYSTPGNEARTEHLARHVWSRILERAPVVLGAQSWGSDLEQLTVRFGTPARRTRVPGGLSFNESIVDHFDARQLAYTPENLLTDGVPPPPLPGRPWALARKRERAGYTARTVTNVRILPHQVSRFPDGEGVLIRFDGVFPDSLPATHGRIEAGLWLFPENSRRSVEKSEVIVQQSDTVRFSFEANAEPGDWVYGLEAVDRADSAAARARFSISIETPARGPRISDPVIVEPFRARPPPTSRSDEGFRPFASLTFTTADTIGVYVEASDLEPAATARLRLSLQPASRANLPARLIGWIGRTIGLSEPRDPVFVEWTAAADPDGRLVLAFELPPQGIDDGDHVLVARLTELATGASTESRRVLRFVPPDT